MNNWAYVSRIYQRSRRGTKVVLYWVGSGEKIDAFFYRPHPWFKARQYVLIGGSAGYGAHNRNKTWYVNRGEVLEVASRARFLSKYQPSESESFQTASSFAGAWSPGLYKWTLFQLAIGLPSFVYALLLTLDFELHVAQFVRAMLGWATLGTLLTLLLGVLLGFLFGRRKYWGRKFLWYWTGWTLLPANYLFVAIMIFHWIET